MRSDRRPLSAATLPLLAALTVAPGLGPAGCAPAPHTGAMPSPRLAESPPSEADVRLTWLSITNWLLEAGDTRVLLDGYLTRVDRRLVEADGSSHGAAVTDTAELRRLLVRAVPDLRIDWILVGHGHWDHAFDVPALARLTGARIAGSRTVCVQAEALGVPPARCTPVEGGEALELGPELGARVVRWHHSGDPATEAGRRLSMPLELRAPPPVDPAIGGLRPGFLEDYPNGGGARAYLITAGAGPDRTTLFWSNTANPALWDRTLAADLASLREAGVDVSNLRAAGFPRPTRELLAAALRQEGLQDVDVWIGFPGPAHLRQVVPLLRPRAFIPHHWDDFWTAIGDRPAEPFDPSAIRPFLDSAGVALVIPAAYFQPVTPLFAVKADTYQGGFEAGAAAAREAGGGDVFRFTLGTAGGLFAGVGLPFLKGGAPSIAGGLGLTFLASEAGPAVPPAQLSARARAVGATYAEGFARGFAVRRRAERRRLTWTGAGIGAAAGLVFVLFAVLPGYT